MNEYAAIILLLLTHVVAGRQKCRVCAELQKMNSKLAELQQIDAKLDHKNATLDKLASGGEFSNSFIRS